MADQDDQTKQAEDPKTDEAEGKPKGAPDWQRAAEDYKAQRDAARKQSEELTSQLTDLKTSVEGLKSADDVQKAVDAALEKANAGFEDAKGKWAEREKSLVVGSALAQAGCIDSGALLFPRGHVQVLESTKPLHVNASYHLPIRIWRAYRS